jgi:hypothetical protein
MVALLQAASSQERLMAAQNAVGAIPGITAADQIVAGAILVASGMVGVEDEEASEVLDAVHDISVQVRGVLRSIEEKLPADGVGAVGTMSADPVVIRAGEQP